VPVCPKCGERFRISSGGHCQVCCRTFTSDQAGEAHRTGRHGVDRRCKTEQEMLAEQYEDGTPKWWRNARGEWGHGRRREADTWTR